MYEDYQHCPNRHRNVTTAKAAHVVLLYVFVQMCWHVQCFMPGVALLAAVMLPPRCSGCACIVLSSCCCPLCWLQVRATDVQLPEGATFVVANSLAVSKKAETADRR